MPSLASEHEGCQGRQQSDKDAEELDERWMQGLREGKTEGLYDESHPQESSGVISHQRRVQRRA